MRCVALLAVFLVRAACESRGSVEHVYWSNVMNGTSPAPENSAKWEGSSLVDSVRDAHPQLAFGDEALLGRGAVAPTIGTLGEHADRSELTLRAAQALELLARGVALRVAAQPELYAAIDANCASTDAAWRFGEEAAFARVVLALVLRPDFDEPAFEAWIARHESAYRELCSASSLDTALLAEVANRWRVLAELAALLADDRGEARVAAARERVLASTS